MVGYKFDEKLKEGMEWEEVLDQVLSRWYQIEKVHQELQRQGLDRIFKRKDDGTRYGVEYKTDISAFGTDNIFIELVSVDRDNKPGWAYSSIAQRLIVFIPQLREILVADLNHIRDCKLKDWIEKYPKKKIPNEGYNTIGIPVPKAEFQTSCTRIEFIESQT